MGVNIKNIWNHHLENLENNEINYLPQLVSRISEPSTVSIGKGFLEVQSLPKKAHFPIPTSPATTFLYIHSTESSPKIATSQFQLLRQNSLRCLWSSHLVMLQCGAGVSAQDAIFDPPCNPKSACEQLHLCSKRKPPCSGWRFSSPSGWKQKTSNLLGWFFSTKRITPTQGL